MQRTIHKWAMAGRVGRALPSVRAVVRPSCVRRARGDAPHLGVVLCCLLGCWLACAEELDSTRSPFEISIATNADGGLKVEFLVPEDCVLYAERLHFYDTDGNELPP